MKTNLQTRLIDGEYTIEEAREILVNLYSNKIKFHDLKIFNSMIRFGKEDTHSKKRIAELKQNLQEITEYLNSLETNNQTISIKSNIEIELKAIETVK